MTRDARSPQTYRDSVTGDQRALLEALRGLILEVAPGTQEGIAYGMLDYPGLANLAAQKQYVSLYVMPSVLDHHRASLGTSCGKSCVRFKRLSQVDRGAILALLRDVQAARRAGPAPGAP